MSIDESLKKRDFVLIKEGTESVGRGGIKFVGNVIGFIQEITGDYAKVNVAFQDNDITLRYRLKDLEKY